MSISNTERLNRFYDLFLKSDQVLIIINADPDAMASAQAVKRLLWRKVAGIVIACINRIERPDNIVMADLLKIGLTRLSKIKRDDFARFVLVDSQPSHSPKLENYNFDVIIDHHPLEPDTKSAFMDVRPSFGATAGMMTEYIKAARIKPSSLLATALCIGIKTDTSDFERKASNGDVMAFQYLYKYVNVNIIKKFEKAELKLKYLKYFENALRNRKVSRGKLVTHIDAISSPDVCVIIADFFMSVDSISWCFVSGIHNKKLVVVIRNDGIRKNAGKLAKKRFSELGSAGGHKSMARAEIPLEELNKHCDSTQENKVMQWLIKRLK